MDKNTIFISILISHQSITQGYFGPFEVIFTISNVQDCAFLSAGNILAFGMNISYQDYCQTEA